MCGSPAVPKISAMPSEIRSMRAVRRFVAQSRLQEVLDDLAALRIVIRHLRDGVEELAEAEVEVRHHQDAEQDRAAPSAESP